MFARAIYIFSGIIAVAIFGYAHLYMKEDVALYAVPFLILAVGVFVLSPQINWWYYKKNPEKIDADLKRLLQKAVPFYRDLSAEDKAKFEQRLNLFLMAKDFQPMKLEEVGEDLKAAVAISALQLTFNREEDWMFDTHEKIIIYPHPFPTPQYEEWHITEHYDEDGVLIFTAQHLMHGFFQPLQYLNIALYEWANIYIKQFLQAGQLTLNADNWRDLEKISGFTEEKMKAYVGLNNLNPLAIGISFYFTHRERFSKFLPEEFARMQGVFS